MRLMTRWAVVLFLMAGGRAQADLTLTIQPASGVDISNIYVGDSFEVDLIGGQADPSDTTERITGGGFQFGSTGNLTFTGSEQGPNAGAPLVDAPIIYREFFTANAAGSSRIVLLHSDITTNERTYTDTPTQELDFTVKPAAVATPEPSTIALVGAGIPALLVVGYRRRRQQAG